MAYDKDMFRGIWVETVTPFDYEGKIIRATIERHYHMLINSGVRVVFPLSLTGEGPSLTLHEKISIIRTYGELGSQLRLVPAIIEPAIEDAKRLIRAAVMAGIDGAVIFFPYMYKGLTTKGIYEYYRILLDYIRELSMNTCIFLPFKENRNGFYIDELIIKKLTRKYPEICGVIDYSSDFSYMDRLRKKNPDILYISALEIKMLEGLRRGTDGYVSKIANVIQFIPREILRYFDLLEKHLSLNNSEHDASIRSGIMDHFSEKELNVLELYSLKIGEFYRILNKYPEPASLKYILYQQQFPALYCRTPLENLTEDQKTVMKDEIKRLMCGIKELEKNCSKIPGKEGSTGALS